MDNQVPKIRMLPQPKVRFKHLKKNIDGGQWSHFERHWKLQMAFAQDADGNIMWQDVEDQYFYDDGSGDEKSIPFEEYRDATPLPPFRMEG